MAETAGGDAARGGRRDDTLLAIAISLLALLLFDLMGMVIKLMSDRYPAAELSAWRNLFGLVPSLMFLVGSAVWRRSGRPLRIRQWRLAMVRGMAATLAQLMFYLSLGTLAFATATTISYANAVFTTALAVPLLGERVGPVRWAAVAVGFLGVLWIAEPWAEGIGWGAAPAAAAAALYAFMGVTARLVDGDVPTPLFNLHSSLWALAGSTTLAFALGGFTPVASLADLGMLALMGAFGGCAVFCLVIAYRMTEPSNLAPFSYFGIPIAVALGWLGFGETPFDELFPGALLIAAGGLIIVHRERRLRRDRRAAAAEAGRAEAAGPGPAP